MESLTERVRRTAARYGMLPKTSRAGVAVSGGADSVCLLHVLLDLGVYVHVLHLNHGLRGEESRQDAEFVRELAASLKLDATIRDADVPVSGGNLEQAARQARYDFFRETIITGGVACVATGHTRSDQAETVLFRFLRGSGTAGLAGIRPVTAPGIVRPLIEVDRADVEQFLRARKLPWRDDSTNASPRFARNRIRHHLLPQLARDWNPAIAETLAHTADWALAEESWWESEIDRLAAASLIERSGAVLVRADTITGLPLAVARRLLRRALETAKGDLRRIDFHHILSVMEMAGSAQGHGRIHLPGVEVLRSFEWLRFGAPGPESSSYTLHVEAPGILRIPAAGLVISLELIEKAETSEPAGCVYNIEMGCLDWPRLSGSLQLRNWRPGDRYQPANGGSQKIKTLFQQARIPSWDRRSWPILTDGSEIVWVRRFGPAARVAAGVQSGTILRIREIQSA